MVTLNTLDSLIDDILEEARNGNISESESITRIQIEQWIHQYRALLIKQDLDKGRYTNPNYIQYYDALAYDLDTSPNNKTYYVLSLPKTIDLHFKSGLVSIYNIAKNQEIQLCPKSRIVHQAYKKYSKKETLCYLENDKLIVVSTFSYGNDMQLSIGGIFEDPSLVPGFSSSNVYPIPANMIPTLKQLIFEKEFKVTLSFPTDDKNNSNNELRTTPQQK